MEQKRIVKREIEEEVTEKMFCDNCNKEIEYPNNCGCGAEYRLSDAWCSGCGGKNWDFCSLKCLKDFVNKLNLKEAPSIPPNPKGIGYP